MTEGYLRQRRNLLSLSILLLLAILGGAEDISLLTLKLKHPEVAEYFAWTGFLYFWYRVYIYAPSNLTELFKNEIMLRQLLIYQKEMFYNLNLSEFTGSIEVSKYQPKEGNTQFTFRGNSAGNDIENLSINIPLYINKIFSLDNCIHNVFNGKVATDYFLPHIIAITTMSIEINKYYPHAISILLPVIIVGVLLYIWVSNKK